MPSGDDKAVLKQVQKENKQLKRTASQRKGPGRGGSAPGVTKKAQRLLRGNGRGRLTPRDERQLFIQWINEAVAAGARRSQP